MPTFSTTVSESDLSHLRRAIFVSIEAKQHGNHPFGAVLTDETGTQVLEAENTVVTHSDVTGHAETNLVRLATKKYSLEQLRGFTLYTSCEPCAMCSGAIYWAGIGRMVYALPEQALIPLTGNDPQNPTLDLPSREVLTRGQRTVVVAGPALEEQAAEPHRGFWR
ncbi:nucleoside deaminase [Agreia pratensis]|uniref:tRNA(Arg) A34 adenosine deaminase TadA n=1 Tax=Agreia pratensis TaxID=150121 RepID=A0A1X7JCJ6_9MICO|nr:nucleoside deaminase [Agreia pratensis]MBF4635115.1 nucleoside deaminase [Agreia pratensis]SMG25235.1 tRNA(Arg) A34 adenosine deaminase TadA [Agreia pratensis]